MTPRKKAQAAFAAAVGLLLLSGMAGYLTTARLLESAKLVVHTQEVRATLGDIDAAVLQAGRSRSGYVAAGADDQFNQFETAGPLISQQLENLRQLTTDNPKQQAFYWQLEAVMSQRLRMQQESILQKKNGTWKAQMEPEFQRQMAPLSLQMTTIMQQMRGEEQRLLSVREHRTNTLFRWAVASLLLTFLVALGLLALHYKLLTAELRAREEAERIARESEDSLRQLTGRLLQLQDVERRKFSRELHDSLGQYLAGVKMNLEMYAQLHKDNLLAEAVQLLDHSIGETRTISHLLHPPLLDEAGLASAARWYLEGFAQRSGVKVKIDMPDEVSQLPKPIALGLFRVLQESLTNIHRHSESTKADVSVEMVPNRVILKVRDYGKGISPGLLRAFQTQTMYSGVGLAGMRERMRELGGQMTIQPSKPGTLITVVMPYSAAPDAASAAD